MENPNPNQEGKPTPEDGGEEVPVTRAEFEALKKGVAKGFSEKGQEGEGKEGEQEEGAEKVTPEAKPTPSETAYNPIVKKIYMKDTPEIAEVWDEVEKEAKELGQDPIEYYEGKKGWQLEAQARAKAKQEKEQTKNDIDSPSGTITKDTKINFDKITPEQIKNLDADARNNYREHLRRTEGGVSIRRLKN